MLISLCLILGLFWSRGKTDESLSGDINDDIIAYVMKTYHVPPFLEPPPISPVALQNVKWHNLIAGEWLDRFNEAYRQVLHVGSLLDWSYNTNLTVVNAKKVSEFGLWRTFYMRPWRNQAKVFNVNLLPSHISRQIQIVGKSSSSIAPKKSRELMTLHRSLQRLYSAGKIRLRSGEYLSGEPDLARLMQTSRNPNFLLAIWKSWRDAVGPKMKDQYLRFVELQNELAQSGGHPDIGDVWRREMNIEDLEAVCNHLYYQIQPLYRQLHAYVRRKLSDFYGAVHVNSTGPVPAHLFGNMWAQEWDVMDIVMPYPKFPLLDVTPAMKRLNFTPLTMFRTAEDFFLSIGLEPMTQDFWKKSMFEKPKDGREVACHGSSTNFFDGKDYRIRMCTQVTMQDLNTVHHEMGHVEYFMQYRHQPILFQDSANSAFHEAIGDTVQYSFLTPEHLYQIGLADHLSSTREEDINFLMRQALMKLPLIPFSFVIDKWRWELFRGDIDATNANKRWWQLRMKYQGVKPPLERTENDFDPGAKYHIPDNTPYIRYFISSFIQVQFHKALCLEHYKESGMSVPPLHRCNIYRSQKAGNLLKSVLSLGSSRSWQEAMTIFTGQQQILADALLEYYAPLHEWLRRENKKNGETIGW